MAFRRQHWCPICSRSNSLFLGREGMENITLFGICASNGGSFLSILAHVFTFRVMLIQISSGVVNALEKENFPKPVSFVYMENDKIFTGEKRNKQSIRILKNKEIKNS